MSAKTKILVPVDFSPTAEHALQFALQLGNLLEADLHLLHVIYPQMEDIDHPMRSSTVATLTKSKLAEKKLQAFLATEVEKWERRTGPAPTTCLQVEVGGAIAVIKRKVKNEAYDLVIMGTRDKHDSVEHVLGTVASDVVGHAACPVIVVPQQYKCTGIERVAHAIEPRMVDPAFVLERIQQFRSLHRKLHLVRFADDPEDTAPHQLLQLKEAVNNQFADLRVETHRISKNDLVPDINRFVEQYEIDLLVMYRSSGNCFRRLFHRSHTRRMARYTRIPLLVI